VQQAPARSMFSENQGGHAAFSRNRDRWVRRATDCGCVPADHRPAGVSLIPCQAKLRGASNGGLRNPCVILFLEKEKTTLIGPKLERVRRNCGEAALRRRGPDREFPAVLEPRRNVLGGGLGEFSAHRQGQARLGAG
jgi:hypothetical protein